MYPKNAASPERIAVGPVVQISDGAVQTSGVSIKVVPQGGAAGAGGGTTGYEEGIVHYIPTQAETNYSSFMVLAYKAGCIPASVTVVTTASATAGYAGVDWSKVTAPTSTVGLSGTTIKTATDVETDTADIQSRIGTAGAGLTAVPWNAAWDAEVQSEVADGLTAFGAATVGDIPTAGAIADAAADEVYEGSLTLRQIVRIFLAAMAGKSSGHELGTPAYRDNANTKDRIAATTDANGNRTSVTLDGS